MKRIVVSGAAGRMGKSLIRELTYSDDMVLAAALVSSTSVLKGKNSGEVADIVDNEIPLSHGKIDCEFDVMVDFSQPEAVRENLKFSHSFVNSFFTIIEKFPETLGILKFYFNRVFGITDRLIEYK